MVTAPFFWVPLCTRFCLCPPRVCFPVLCKFWKLYGGVNDNLLQEGLCHIQVCTQSPCSRPLLTLTFTGDSTKLKGKSDSVSVGSLWCTQGFVSALWMSLVGIRFDFKCKFTLLPSHWGFSPVLGHGIDFFGGIQHSPVTHYSAGSRNLGCHYIVFLFFFLIFSLKLALSLYSFILIRGSLAHSACPLPLNTHTHC